MSSSISGVGMTPSSTGRSQPGPLVGEDRDAQRIESCKQFAALETSDSINEDELIWQYEVLCFYNSKDRDDVHES